MSSYAKSLSFIFMKVSILNIGDEILAGKTLNTNSYWIKRKLSFLGIFIQSQATVQDNDKAIISGLNYCIADQPDYLIITGGLGPTDDDITRNVLFNFMNVEAKLDYEYFNFLKNKYKTSNIPINESIKGQALIPNIGEFIPNPNGSARGLKFKKNNTTIFALPGVPMEMKKMISEYIIPQIRENINNPIFSRTLRTTGISESELQQRIGKWEKNDKNKIGFYPNIYGVDIRVSNKTSKEIEVFVDWMYESFNSYIYSENDTDIEKVIVEECINNGNTLSIAESCSGGLIGDRITNVSGSSKIFNGGVVAYSNESKVNILGLKNETLEKFGSVSEETAKCMAQKVKTLFKSSYGLAVTGIAGPDGGTEEKPVGLVYISLASNSDTYVEKFNFGSNRKGNKMKTSQMALNILRRIILNG